MAAYIPDLILAALLVLAILYGWRWGTINVIARVGSLVLAYKAARAFSAQIAAYLVEVLPPFNSAAVDTAGTAGAAGAAGAAGTAGAAEGAAEAGDQLLNLLGLFIDTSAVANRLVEVVVFIIVFVVVNWAVRKLAYMLTGIFGRGLLGKLNKALGALVALVLMLAIIIVIMDIVLPVCADMGFGQPWLDYMESSRIIWPFIASLGALI